MKKIVVHLKDRSYSIIIEALNHKFLTALKKIGVNSNSKLLIVTSPTIKKAGHLHRLVRILKRGGFHSNLILIPDGEKHKNFGTLAALYQKALTHGLDRNSLVIALGGGVITDMVGFFAATYMRGIRYVSMPSTLLAMVDAAIGGKTGVDLPEGKNLVGSFWQPSLVWIDPFLLSTLRKRDWKTGMAEVVKYGVIRDRQFFKWISTTVRKNPNIQNWKPAQLEKAIHVSAQIKAEVVSKDEKEIPLKGGREILNFGHTIGHALESATNYQTLTHGEAVGIGMVAAGQLALKLGLWNLDGQLQLMSLLDALGLPLERPSLSRKQWGLFWSAILKDKKNISGKLRFVLPKKIGQVEVRSGISAGLIKSILR